MQADSFGDTELIPELWGSVPQRIPSRDFRAHPWVGGLWRCSCVLKTQLHCWEIMARLLPGGFGDDRDPCGSRWPLDSGGESCRSCKRLCDTTLWARAELRPSLIPKYWAHNTTFLCLLSCLWCMFVFPCFPEEWQCERWLLWQTDCRLSLAYLCLTAELGPRVTHLWEGVMAPIAVLLKSSLNDWNGSWPSLFLRCLGFGIGQRQACGDWVVRLSPQRPLKLLQGELVGHSHLPAQMCQGCGVSSALYYVCHRRRKKPGNVSVYFFLAFYFHPSWASI